MNKKKWEAEKYHKGFSFVYEYGSDVIDLIEIKKGDSVLDIGCGSGVLTNKIRQMGANVIGIDSSKDMLLTAKKNYPHIDFQNIDATEINFKNKFDIVFSNAVFHWIKDQNKLINCISNSLKKGGHLICEFGGMGCGERVHNELKNSFEKRGHKYIMPFYFPTIGQYTPILEKYCLKTEFALLFDRPTYMEGDNGLADWINMFVTQPFEKIDINEKDEIIKETSENLYPILHKDDGWYIDYVRIRLKAVKI